MREGCVRGKVAFNRCSLDGGGSLHKGSDNVGDFGDCGEALVLEAVLRGGKVVCTWVFHSGGLLDWEELGDGSVSVSLVIQFQMKLFRTLEALESHNIPGRHSYADTGLHSTHLHKF